MTVCIAAMAESGRKIVLATDRMITANFPIPTEFETQDVLKIFRIGETAIVMSAGNALSAYEIIERAKSQVVNQQIGKIDQVTEIVRRTYQDYRRQRVLERFLEPRGLSLDSYYASQQRMIPGVAQEIDSQLINYNLQVEMIITGCREGDECHLFTLTHPGISLLHDALGYASIGSGSPHVMYDFIGSDYRRAFPVKKVEEIVRSAKRKSEVAPGVGRQTELIILPEDSKKV